LPYVQLRYGTDWWAMQKRVILATGTPCVGKSSTARLLTDKLGGFYVNLTDLAMRENLISGEDKERGSIIVDRGRMKRKIRQIIGNSDKKDIIIDGHYAVDVVPKELVTYVFVLRRDPVELRQFMVKAGFSGRKLIENLASEILDVCLVDALNVHGKGKICELNVTGKSPEEVAEDILAVMSDSNRCCVGIVDWLGKLESEGLLDEFLKI
jgi:adenylate kinase